MPCPTKEKGDILIIDLFKFMLKWHLVIFYVFWTGIFKVIKAVESFWWSSFTSYSLWEKVKNKYWIKYICIDFQFPIPNNYYVILRNRNARYNNILKCSKISSVYILKFCIQCYLQLTKTSKLARHVWKKFKANMILNPVMFSLTSWCGSGGSIPQVYMVFTMVIIFYLWCNNNGSLFNYL